MFRSAFAWRHAANHIRAVLNHLLSMESSLTPRKSLDEEASSFVYQDAHRAPTPRATTLGVSSFISSALVRFKPLSRRICCLTSTLVLYMRTSTGTLSCRSFAAAT